MKKLCALFLSLVLILGMIPTTVFAAEQAINKDTDEKTVVAKIDEATETDLKKAVEAAKAGETINVTENAEITEDITISKNITVIIAKGTTLTVLKDKTLTIEEGATLMIEEGATLTKQGNIANRGTIVVKDDKGLKSVKGIPGYIKLGASFTTANPDKNNDNKFSSVIIDLNGFTLSNNSQDRAAVTAYYGGATIIKDSSVEKTGTVIDSERLGRRAAVKVEGGNLTIESGNFLTKGKKPIVWIHDNIELTIKGGTFSNLDTSDDNNIYNGSLLNYVADGSAITLSEDYTLKGDATIKANTTLVIPEGVSLTIAEGVTLTVEGKLTNNGTINKVGAITETGTVDGTGMVYKVVNSEDELTSALTTGGSVKLSDDITITKQIKCDKAVTLDGNNKTITSSISGSRALWFVGDNTTIKNLKVNGNAQKYVLAFNNGGLGRTIENLNLDNVTITNYSGTAIDVNGVKNLTLNNVTANEVDKISIVLDNVDGFKTEDCNLSGGVSIHNKWGAIKNINLSTANKVKVEDFSVDGDYTFDGDDTKNNGNKTEWKIFEQAGDSPILAAGTITLGNNMYPTVVSKPVDSQLRAYAVEYNYNPPYVPPTEPEDKPEPPKVDEDGKVEVPVTKPDENGKVEADVPDGVVSDALDKIIADVEAGKKENIVVEIKVETDSKAEAVDVKVDAAAIDKIAKTENATLKVESNVGALELDNDVLKEISKNAGGEKVNISIEKPKVENMPAKQQEKIKEVAKEGMVFDLSITAGDKKISNLGGTATLSVDYDLPENEVAEGVRVYFIDDNGKAKLVDAYYDAKTNKIIMKTDHFSVYVVSYVDVPTKVSILKAKNAQHRASLRWSRATNDPEGYRVYRSATKDGKYNPIAWVKNGKAKTYTEKAKKTNKTYYYKVRAYKKVNGKCVWGAYSPIKVVKF